MFLRIDDKIYNQDIIEYIDIEEEFTNDTIVKHGDGESTPLIAVAVQHPIVEFKLILHVTENKNVSVPLPFLTCTPDKYNEIKKHISFFLDYFIENLGNCNIYFETEKGNVETY